MTAHSSNACDAQLAPVGDGHVAKLTFSRGGARLSYAEAIDGWRYDHDFRELYIEQLKRVPFGAFFWEAPPLTRASAGQPYECVLVDSPELAGARAEPDAFARVFDALPEDERVAVFANLGADATLIAPRPGGPERAYAHLASFVRSAQAREAHALLRTLGATLDAMLGEAPLWVSTCGLGVLWLHVRLDMRPKYYTFAPYKKA